jgi:FdhD protein
VNLRFQYDAPQVEETAFQLLEFRICDAVDHVPRGQREKLVLIHPDPTDPRLTRKVEAVDQFGKRTEISVVEERPLTIYLNSQEIVTAMTIGDYPEFLAVGYLRNQGMLEPDENITVVQFDEELETVVVRTERETDYEEKLKKKTRTSGCAVGTVFGDMMEGLDEVVLPEVEVKVSDLYALAHKINTMPSLYLEAGAIHGTVLCRGSEPLAYMEDVGRHNAVDKIAGLMVLQGIPPQDKILYTTGRLTSEMVIKTALMGIPVLASRSGFTAWGVEIARKVGLTLIGRMRGQRYLCLSGEGRLTRDVEVKAARPDDERQKVRAEDG